MLVDRLRGGDQRAQQMIAAGRGPDGQAILGFCSRLDKVNRETYLVESNDRRGRGH